MTVCLLVRGDWCFSRTRHRLSALSAPRSAYIYLTVHGIASRRAPRHPAPSGPAAEARRGYTVRGPTDGGDAGPGACPAHGTAGRRERRGAGRGRPRPHSAKPATTRTERRNAKRKLEVRNYIA